MLAMARDAIDGKSLGKREFHFMPSFYFRRAISLSRHISLEFLAS